jgi:hypothetical protein
VEILLMEQPVAALPAASILLSSTCYTSTMAIGFFEVVGLEGGATQKLQDSTGFTACKEEWQGATPPCPLN